jgi:hypothetical protein
MMASRAEKRAFWVRHVEASAASGLGRLAYCEAHGLKPGTLDVWQKNGVRVTFPSRGRK